MANRIESMTPNEAWEAYVGSESPKTWVGLSHDDVNDYVCNSPVCEGLSVEERTALAFKLEEHIQE